MKIKLKFELLNLSLKLLALFPGGLPHLKNVVLGNRGKHYPLVEVPRQIRDLSCVTAVNEHTFSRTVFLLLLGKLVVHANPGKIPNNNCAVTAARC
jgi:hypothetical protein